jgi:hypothetical protein
METKLTLRLNKRTIDKAKDYAQAHKTSISKMVEAYLESVMHPNTVEAEITPLVASLSGVIELEQDYDYKKEYTAYISEKYQ